MQTNCFVFHNNALLYIHLIVLSFQKIKFQNVRKAFIAEKNYTGYHKLVAIMNLVAFCIVMNKKLTYSRAKSTKNWKILGQKFLVLNRQYAYAIFKQINIYKRKHIQYFMVRQWQRFALRHNNWHLASVLCCLSRQCVLYVFVRASLLLLSRSLYACVCVCVSRTKVP